jgi:hypothetical protein
VSVLSQIVGGTGKHVASPTSETIWLLIAPHGWKIPLGVDLHLRLFLPLLFSLWSAPAQVLAHALLLSGAGFQGVSGGVSRSQMGSVREAPTPQTQPMD